MSKYLGISAIALGAVLSASAPALAVSLNVGGSGPVVSTGGSSDSNSTVSVDTDDGVGVDVNLDSTTNGGGGALFGTGEGATVDLNGGDTDGDVNLDVNGGGDDVIVDLFGNGGEDGAAQALVDVNSEDEAVVDADLLNGGEDSVLIDLFGETGGNATAEASLADGTGDFRLLNDEVLGELFGSAEDGSVGSFEDVGQIASIDSEDGVTTIDALDETAVVTLGEGLDTDADLLGEDAANLDFGDDSASLDVLDDTADANINIDGQRAAVALFNEDAEVEADLGDVGVPTLGGLDVPEVDGAVPTLGGLDVPEVDGIDLEVGDIGLGGSSSTSAQSGGDTGDEMVAEADSGDSFDLGQDTGGLAAGVAVDAAAQASRCFSPDASQISHLVERETYDAQTVAEWDDPEAIRVIAVTLCPAAKVRVSEVVYSDPNMAFLRTAVEQDGEIRAKLTTAGRDADDVLAVDRKGDNLVVYVY